MPVINPQTFFRFAAENHELLVELYHRRNGITEAELLQMIRQFIVEGGPSSSYIVNRLRELGFIDYAPHATAQYEMTRPFAELMSSLLREYRMTSVEAIRGYFTAMETMADELAQANKDNNGDLLVRSLDDMSEHAERMRHDSRRNHDEIITTSMRLKSNQDRITPKRRYEIINRLWTRYLVPLRDMIDIQKSMDAALDRMERVLEDAEECFQLDGAVLPGVIMSRARVRRLRRDVLLDFRESIREVTPLYDELRRENALARGATHALEVLSKQGLTHLALPQQLGICNFQQQGLFSDTALEAYIHTLHSYVPARPRSLKAVKEEVTRDHIRLNEFDAAVTGALPITDVWTWLLETYPNFQLNTLLKLYGRVHSGRYGDPIFAFDEKKYRLQNITLTVHLMRVDKTVMS